MTDASHLLSLLRAGASTSNSSSSPKSSRPAEPNQSLPIVPTSPLNETVHGTDGNAGADLERLFRSAFNTSHPSHQSGTTATAPATSSPDNGTSNNSTGPRAADTSGQHIDIAPLSSTSSSPASPNRSGPTSTNPGSASLLSLLQKMSSPPTSTPPPAPSMSHTHSTPTDAPATAPTSRATQAPVNGGTNLLERLMARKSTPTLKEANPAISSSIRGMTLEEIERQSASEKAALQEQRETTKHDVQSDKANQHDLAKANASSTAAPGFGSFVSPFDLLAQAQAKEEQQMKQKIVQQAPQQTENPDVVTQNPLELSTTIDRKVSTPVSAIPSHVAGPASVASGNDSEEMISAPAIDSASSHELLAKNHLPKTPVEQPSWAPRGLRLPPRRVSAASTTAQRLTIDITSPNLESLDSASKVEHTPVVLFEVPPVWSNGHCSAISQSVFLWATKKGRIRVVDRKTGAKLLIKGGHKSSLLDLAISPSADSEGLRTIASVGIDGRLIVYKVPESFSEDDPPASKVLDVEASIASAGAKFQYVRFHPDFPRVPRLAISLDNGNVTILQLERAQEAGVTFASASRTAACCNELADLAFSPDGTAFAVLAKDGSITIRKTSAPEKVLWYRKEKDHIDASQIAFVSNKEKQPAAIIASSRNGTRVQLLPLSPINDTGDSSHAIEFSYPAAVADDAKRGHFGHVLFHSPSSTLFVSSSLRGSLFAFRIAIDSLPASSQSFTGSDIDLITSIAASRAALHAPRVEHVAEIATSEPIIQFSIDHASYKVIGHGLSTLTTLIAYPGGLHAVDFEYQRQLLQHAGSTQDSSDEDEVVGRPGRRMSLEGSIRVESEVAVTVDVGEEVQGEDLGELTRGEGKPVIREASIAEEQVTVKERSEQVQSTLPPVQAEVQTPARDSAPLLSTTKRATPPAPPLSPPAAAARAVSNAWATGQASPVATSTPPKKSSASADMAKELRKVEERVTKAVQKELEKHAHQAEKERANDRTSDSARQETTIQLVSSSLSKKVDATIKEQMRSQVIPAMSKLVTSAINEQVARGMDEALNETLPKELKRLLSRPDIGSHIAENIASSIIPSVSAAVESQLMAVVASGVVPNFNLSLNNAIDNVMQSVHNEFRDVRKEIVQEQAGAIVDLEGVVEDLRGEVSDLKSTLMRMEQMILSIKESDRAVAALDERPSSSQVHLSRQASFSHVSVPGVVPAPVAKKIELPQHQYSLPPIPRDQTPEEEYEEMFTNALQPQHEPEFLPLLHLIKSSPPARVERVFPAKPGTPKVSPPVVLSLAYQLSDRFAAASGPFDEDARKQLIWVRRSLSAMDTKSDEVRAFTPKVIESVISNLHTRGRSLATLQDRRGIDEVKTVEKFAKSQLRLFETDAMQGFRR